MGGRTALRVTATLVFVKSVNGLLKGMLDKGERAGAHQQRARALAGLWAP